MIQEGDAMSNAICIGRENIRVSLFKYDDGYVMFFRNI